MPIEVSKADDTTTGMLPCRDVEGPGHSAQWLNLHDQDVGGAHRGDFQRVRPEANQFVGGERDSIRRFSSTISSRLLTGCSTYSRSNRA